MKSYREYVIRCKTCNEQIACHAKTYEQLLANGLSIEEALNSLDIMLPCSRAWMMNPNYVTFNMENRDVVEGIRSVQSIEDDFLPGQRSTPSISNPVFASCLSPTVIAAGSPQTQPQREIANILPQGTPAPVIAAPTAAQVFNARLGAAGMQTIATVQPIRMQTRLNVQPLQPVATNVIAPIIPIDSSILAAPIGVGIPINALEADTVFKEPTTPGVPTINHDPKLAPVTIHVGAGKYCTVLNGRTYLAQ